MAFFEKMKNVKSRKVNNSLTFDLENLVIFRPRKFLMLPAPSIHLDYGHTMSSTPPNLPKGPSGKVFRRCGPPGSAGILGRKLWHF